MCTLSYAHYTLFGSCDPDPITLARTWTKYSEGVYVHQCDFRFDLFFSFSFSFPVIFSF